ncbi:MAG: HesA/MoeB/ThiF family protein [Bacteroidales bacterium]|nr:HesA/MoeB/ThiF family protein [Bacteroidales bacterium]
MASSILSSAELKRYEKHLSLPEIGQEGQEKLKSSRVLVIGAGSLGTPVLLYLAASGIGKIGIVDFDKIEAKNLQCQLLYGDKDIGKHKVIIARQRLAEMNPNIDFEILNLEIKENNVQQLISQYDLILDTTNRFSFHYIIDDACRQGGKAWIYSSMKGFHGELAVFNYQGGPAFRDVYPDEDVKKERTIPYKSGIIAVLPGLMGSIQVAECLKIQLGFGDILSGKLLTIDLKKNQYSVIRI